MQPLIRLKSVIAPLIILMALGALFAGDSAPGAVTSGPQAAEPSKSPPELSAELKAYRSWKKLLENPRPVPLNLWELCSRPSPKQWDESRKTHGPHSEHFIQLFVNKQAATGLMAKGEHRFPVGAVIVKEKLKSPYSTTPDGIGVMIKHEGKEFKASGGWEFRFYPEVGDAQKTHQACAACHHGASGKDYVMGDYPDQTDKMAQAVKVVN